MTSLELVAKIKQDPDVTKVVCLPQLHFAVQYEDGAMSFLNSDLKPLKTPMRDYEVIRDFSYLGDLNDVPHFAFKGTNWATRMQSETHIFDIDGKEKLFRDPRLWGLESVFEIQKAFDKGKAEGREFLQEIGCRQSRGMHR
jgi:hypothetical protein